MEVLEASINCQRIKFSKETSFLIQISRKADKKSSFLTVYSIIGDIYQALRLFRDLDIREGYRKRLYAPDLLDGSFIIARHHKV